VAFRGGPGDGIRPRSVSARLLPAGFPPFSRGPNTPSLPAPRAPARPDLPLTLARRRLVLPASAALVLAPSLRRRAAAHALVAASEPAAGAALDAGPARVWVRFNSRIDHARSRLVLHGPENAQAPLRVEEAADAVLLAASAEGVPWAPGAWRLRWQVLALDGHITRGDVPFTLRPR
jgi:copper resistance protein C